MRIPSQFNQGNLYSRDNRRRPTDDSYRRLIRLILGLVLVIAVMHQASKPSMYRVFFSPSQVASNASQQDGGFPVGGSGLGSASAANSDVTSSSVIGDPATSAQLTPEDQRIAGAIVAELLPSDQRQWWVALSRWRSGRPLSLIPSSLESASLKLESLKDVDAESRAAWRSMLKSLESLSVSNNLVESQPGSGPTGQEAPESTAGQTPDASILPQVTAMMTALDRASNDRVVDGSVWRSGDFDSLYHFLDQASRPPDSGATVTGVIPLLQQPDVFRNHWVAIYGGVARTERIEAEDNPFGITHYWQLWLRPIDGADRPMVAIVETIPESVATVGAASTKLEGPEVSVVGRYLKRLAYESGVGADLAPVIVGAITSAPMSQEEMASQSGGVGTEASERTWWPILLACLLGFGSAALVMWRTAAAAKRARQLRGSHRAEPDVFLRDLVGSESRSSEPGEDS